MTIATHGAAKHPTSLLRHSPQGVPCSRPTSPVLQHFVVGSSPSHLPIRNDSRFPQHSSSYNKHPAIACPAASRSIKDLSVSDSLEILDLDSTAVADPAAVRRAYYTRMREVHPDVNHEEDTTDTAALVNAAYTALLKVCSYSRVG